MASPAETVLTLSETDRQRLMALGRHVRVVWCSDACAVARKKKIIRILMKEIMVSLDEAAQAWTCIIHWHGGCHTTVSMSKPLVWSGQVSDPGTGHGRDPEDGRALQ